ncbi:TIGR04255 family protein [Ralstonia pseudosolanacearum]
MTIEALYPCAGNHAVQGAAFVLEWSPALDDQTLRAVGALAPQLRSSFPAMDEQRQITVQLETPRKKPGRHQPKARTAPAPSIAGVRFLNPSGAEPGAFTRLIQIQRENCVISVNEYSNWATVWPRVKRWLDIVLPVALSGRALTAITLQYQDLFLWKDDPSKLNMREVFRANSPYLPPNCFEQSSAWHSHHGFLDEFVGVYQGSLLDNINLNVNLIEGQKQVAALMTHRATLSRPLWSDNATQAIDWLFPVLHSRTKERFTKVFTDEVIAKVNLNHEREIA